MCAGLFVLAAGAWKLAGLQYKEIAEISSFADAVALAQQQRVRGAGQKSGAHRPLMHMPRMWM